MSMLLDNFHQKAITPAIEEAKLHQSTGMVLYSDPDKNSCTVAFENGYNGYQQAEKVPVSTGLLSDWFPLAGDEVKLEINSNSIFIVGPAKLSPEIIKARSRMKSDIHTNHANSTIGGYIM